MGYLSECPLCPAPPYMGKDQLAKGGWGDLAAVVTCWGVGDEG